jgi:hypothetical protein
MVGAFVAAGWGLSSVFLVAAAMYALATLVVAVVGRRLEAPAC